jgi:putative protein-disulfide isomerase
VQREPRAAVDGPRPGGLPDNEVIYIADPMCSWCWGFAPVADRLREHFSDVAGFSVVLGGLRPGDRAHPLDEHLKDTIRPHWQRVAELTGQPFNFEFFDREGFVFDTEPPSRAVVAVRRLAPDRTFEFFKALERGFYVDNVDITDFGKLGPMLDAHGVDAGAFRALIDDIEIKRETRNDFVRARRLGADGFPTVALRRGREAALLTIGYQPADRLIPAAEGYFAG